MTYNIGYIIGSLSRDSINRILAAALVRLAPDDLRLTEIPIRDLPLYNRDDELSPGTAVTQFKQSVEESDGLLLISPEYNRSIPAPMKNAIDWGSRPWGHNSFARKPTGIIGASPGAIGTAVMQASMRSVLSFLDAPAECPRGVCHLLTRRLPPRWGGDRSERREVPAALHGGVRGVRRPSALEHAARPCG